MCLLDVLSSHSGALASTATGESSDDCVSWPWLMTPQGAQKGRKDPSAIHHSCCWEGPSGKFLDTAAKRGDRASSMADCQPAKAQ